MRQKIFITLSIILYAASTEFCQTNINFIRGRVLDDITGKPIINANVFISNSVWGTTTDNSGNFILKNIPAGNHQLVVSIIGYNIEMQGITIEYGSEFKVEFNLKEKAYELNEISVVAEIPEDWIGNLEIFKQFFLGQSDFADECSIENETIIDLYKLEDTLIAKAEKPLIIDNQALGYKVECDLVRFEYNYDDACCTYFFSTKFLELVPKNEEEREKWNDNRRAAYLGSLKHFLISLIRNDFNEKGFSVYESAGYYRTKIGDISAIFMRDSSRTNEYNLKFDNNLIVQYTHGFLRSSQNSVLKILVDSVTLDEFGEPRELLPFQLSDYWATRGIADLLPKDYFAD